MTKHEIEALSQNQPTPLTLQQMKSFAGMGHDIRLVSAQFLHRELQTRYARALVDLHALPFGLASTDSVQFAVSKYESYLASLMAMDPPQTMVIMIEIYL